MYRRCFTLLFFVGLLVRLGALFLYDIWYDEGVTFFTLYRNSTLASFPPLYYWFMSGWTKLFGYSLVSLRLPSVIFSILALFPLSFLAKKHSGKTTSLFVVALCCFSPFQLWYAQEATPYALSLFSGACFMYFAYRWYFYRAKSIIIPIICLFLFCFTDYVNIIFCMPFLFYAAIRKSGKKRIIILCWSLILLASIVVSWLSNNEKIMIYTSWITDFSFASIPLLVNNYFIGYIFSGIVQSFFLFFAVVILIIASREAINKKSRPIGFAFFASLFVAYIFSSYIFPVFISRKLFAISPLFYILAFTGIGKLSKRLKAILLTLIFGFVVFTTSLFFIHIPSFQQNHDTHRFHKGVPFKYPYRHALNYIRERFTDGDIIMYSNIDVRYPLYYYCWRWRWPVDCYYVMLSDYLYSEGNSFETDLIIRQVESKLLYYADEEKNINPAGATIVSPGQYDLIWETINIFKEKGYIDASSFLVAQAKDRMDKFYHENKNLKTDNFILPLHYNAFIDQQAIKNIKSRRIWFINSSWSRASDSFAEEDVEIKEWMHEHYVWQKIEIIDGIIIEMFTRKMDN